MITRSDLEEIAKSQRELILNHGVFDIDCSGLNLAGIDLQRLILISPNFEGANLSKANLRGCYFGSAIFRKADLSEAMVYGSDLSGAEFQEANLRGAVLNRSDLSDSNFQDAKLIDARLSGANISGANFCSAKMSNAILIGVDATNSKMCNADLSHANFSGAILAGTDMRDTKIEGAIFSGALVKNLALSSSNLHIDYVEDIHNSGSGYMTQWEYKILTCAYPTSAHGIHVVKFIDGQEIQDWKRRNYWVTQALNDFGNEGWELIDVIWRQWGETPSGVSDPVYFLKRPRSS